MRFTFTVEIELMHTNGKFAGRDDLAAALEEALRSADPGEVEAGDDGVYNVEDFEVTEQPQPKPVRRRRERKPAPPVERHLMDRRTKDGTDYSRYVDQHNVGDDFAVDAGAPGTGRSIYRITRIDEQGIFGVLTSCNVRELDPSEVI